MALLTLKNITLSYGETHLLDKVNIQLDQGERVCLVGRNGAGKSTLMKVIAGECLADEGEILGRNLTITRLEQEVPTASSGTVYDMVATGLGEIAPLLTEYHRITHQLERQYDDKLLSALEKVQQQIEVHQGWSVEQRVSTVISKLSLNADVLFSALSGGMKRRVLLAKALVAEPDILLLDEPTNHLDIDSIIWLEGFLANYTGTVLFITHDRVFLQAVATRILQLDRGQLTSYPGDYQQYLIRREALLAEEAQHNALFDKKLAAEEVWIRQGIKARRTRNEGRVRALEKLRYQRSQRQEQQGQVKIAIQEAARSGKLVIQAEDIGHCFDDKPLFEHFSTVISRGDKIGILGRNGCGKSTLLSVLLTKMKPSFGHVTLGTNIEVAYFDQLRNQLDETKSVVDNVGQGSDYVESQGERQHIMGYLQNFLFTPERARTPVKALSGGERNRLLLAKLFTQPANILVMDEPTNDLDAETLELLEEVLVSYQGTLIIVSHDRAFINHIVTSTIVFDEDGQLREYVGGYDDWQRQVNHKKIVHTQAKHSHQESKKKNTVKNSSQLSYQQQLTLEALPTAIEQLEAQQMALQNLMSGTDFFQQAPEKIKQAQTTLDTLALELEKKYQLWEVLEEQKNGR